VDVSVEGRVAAAMQPGLIVGDYEVIGRLESSQEGITYKVRNVLVQRFEVLRILPKTVQDDPEKVARFLREAKVHARLSHPNIVSFYHATQLDGQLVMTTELVEGTTLAQRRESGPLPLAEALSYVSQVLSALAYAHASGFVHRDVTPANIIVTREGKARLTGFSLAKAKADPQMTQPGTVMGSLNYMSPEQVKGMTELDGRTDIYSLGVVLYEAVTGCRPFHRKSQFEIMLAHVNELPVAPTIVNPELPAVLSEIILTAMAKDPSHRYQTAEEFQQHLDRLRGAPQPAREPLQQPAPVREPKVPVTRPPFVDRTLALPSSWWPIWVAGFFTFLVVVLAFLAIARRL
jgi:eukaryotic-like serine/threonine-protein kinase